MSALAVQVDSLIHTYGEVLALDRVSFSVTKGKMFGLVGPNGGGKSTTFKILATLLRPASGTAILLGEDIFSRPQHIRQRLGVVFQSPALDKKLTVIENLKYQSALYGLSGSEAESRIAELLKRTGLWERRSDKVEVLSGGLKRRLEIARALVHRPEILILDEPTTGLDPLARRELWTYLKTLGLTVLLTTHLLEEAEACDEVAFIDKGKILLQGAPAALTQQLGGDIITLKTNEPEAVGRELSDKRGIQAAVMEGEVRFEHAGGSELLPKLFLELGGKIHSVTIARPTLEDLFIRETGRKLWQWEQGEAT